MTTSLTLCFASRSKVHCNSGLLVMGRRIFGLVQLNGLSLVPKPPARTTAFKVFHQTGVAKLYLVGS